jgi:hypothetical protein
MSIKPILGPWKPLRTEKKVKILPDQAREILELCNNHNRPTPQVTVSKVSTALRSNTFKYNGEPIIFANDGTLMDGQGRLTACVLTGIPIITDVSFGHDKDAFDTIDRGKIRNEADDLALVGEKNTKALSAALKMICAYLDGHRNSMITTKVYSYQQMKEVLDKHPGIRESVTFSSHHKHKIICAPRVVAAVHFLAAMNASGRVTLKRDEFFSRLSDGTNLTANDPVYCVREKFSTMNRNPDARVKRGIGNLTTMTYLHTLVRGWNACLSGTKMTKIQLVYADNSKTILDDLPDIKNGYRMHLNRDDQPADDITVSP